jgi:drug/metabolite transporter (DMT)-like permease
LFGLFFFFSSFFFHLLLYWQLRPQVIARTSAVTYQVVGHMKTILILILGFVVFNSPVIVRNVVGIAIAMVGMIWCVWCSFTHEPLFFQYM